MKSLQSLTVEEAKIAPYLLSISDDQLKMQAGRNLFPLALRSKEVETMRKHRIWTPELERRRGLYAKLQGLGITLDHLAARSDLDATTFSKALWGEYPADQTSQTLRIVEKAIAQAQKAHGKKSRVRNRPPTISIE
jgi:hypothetical protein